MNHSELVPSEDLLGEALRRAEKMLGSRYDQDRLSAVFEGKDGATVERMLRDLEGRLHRGRTGEKDVIRRRWLVEVEGRGHV